MSEIYQIQVEVTPGAEYPLDVTVDNTAGSLVEVSTTEPSDDVVSVSVAEGSTSVANVVVSDSVTSDVLVTLLDSAPVVVEVSVLEEGNVPFGVALPFFGATAPTNYAFPIGQSYLREDYPLLAYELAPDNTSPFWVDSSTFLMPDLRNVILAGVGPAQWSDTLNKTGGSKDAVVVAHTHSIDPPSTSSSSDSHFHSVDPPSTGTSGDTHTHSINPPNRNSNQSDIVRATGGGNAQLVAGTGAYGPYNTGVISVDIGAFTSGSDYHTHTVNISAFNSGSDSHTHTLDIPAFTSSGASGEVSGTDANLPPFRACYHIMRLL